MRAAIAIACMLAFAGCERVTGDMARQPRYNPAAASPLFADAQATRPAVPGTVAQSSGDLAWVSSGRAGHAVDPSPPASASAPAAQTQLARGRERYAIYCLPCHGERGEGDGEVVRRGFPAPPPLGALALRDATDERLHAAIRQGVGVMYPFADRVSDEDASAIVVYLRVLQRGGP